MGKQATRNVSKSCHAAGFTLRYRQSLNSVNAVTSLQWLVLSADDRNRQLLDQTPLPSANLANSDSAISPNILLSITLNNIYSVTFCASDGQFTLDNFRFCL